LSEAATRDAIVACCRALWDRRLTFGTSGNVSARLDDARLLITSSGASFRTLEAGDLARVDGAGAGEGAQPSTELPLHVAAYAARPDVRFVVHTHPTFCVVWSKCAKTVFPRDTVGARETLGPVGYVGFFPPGSAELADAMAAQLREGFDTVLMERHGLTTVGGDLERPFNLADLAEEAARIAYLSRLLEVT